MPFDMNFMAEDVQIHQYHVMCVILDFSFPLCKEVLNYARFYIPFLQSKDQNDGMVSITYQRAHDLCLW